MGMKLVNAYVDFVIDEKNNTIHMILIPKNKDSIQIYETIFKLEFIPLKDKYTTLKDVTIKSGEKGIIVSFKFVEGIDLYNVKKRFEITILNLFKGIGIS